MGKSTDKRGIAIFIDTAVRCGMKKVVCSPGSRNAPLVIAMDLHPEIETYVIHDERVAAFYALGMSLESGLPVGVVCTSGSAMLNYYPAVAEAFYQEIPLIVMTADRPKEWVNHGDGQTIVQEGVYTNHIRGELTVPEQVLSSDSEAFERDIVDLFSCALGSWRGPLHFNFPITEPMYTITDWEHNLASISLPDEVEKPVLEVAFLQRWAQSERRMILCGQQDVNASFLKVLGDLAEDNSLVVLVENTSNLVHPKFVHCIDRALSTISREEIEDFRPDVLLTFGGAVISKRIKSFLRSIPDLYHCRVGDALPDMDTYRALKCRISGNPAQVVNALVQAEMPRNRSTFGSRWKQRDILMQDATRDFVASMKYSDFTVFHTLLDYLPDNSVLHMGNSSVVRYCQLFQPVKEVIYRSNRGASGIDGSLSTACGAALEQPNRLHVAIIGDVSFFYDSNALWTNYLGDNLRIILINNGGGGIFRIIEGPNTSDQLEKYFEAAPPGKAKYLCEAYDVQYSSAHTLTEIEEILPGFFTMELKSGPHLIEIFTPSEVNDVVLKHFFELYSRLVI